MKYPITLLMIVFTCVINTNAQTHNPNFVDLPNGGVYAVTIDENYVYIGGGFLYCGTTYRQSIARYNRYTGALDTIWDPSSNGYVADIKVSNGYVYVSGFFSVIGGQPIANLARIPVSGIGTADPLWNPNPNNLVRAMEISGNELFIAGFFTSVAGQPRNSIAKVSASGNGDLDMLWNPNPNASIHSIELSGNELFVGGNFTSIGGQSRNSIAKLSITGVGNADPTWNPDAAFGNILAISLFGNDVYVGGSFSVIGGQSRNNIAKLSASGTGAADPIWDANANNIITSLIATEQGVFVGGPFTSIGGIARSYLAKLSATGTGAADPSWSVPLNSSVEDEAIAYGFGVLYAGGTFTSPTSRFFVTGTFSVPTLGEWGMIVFTVSIIGVGVYFSKKQNYSIAV